MGNSPSIPYQPLTNENAKSNQSSKNSKNTYGSSTQDTKPLLENDKNKNK